MNPTRIEYVDYTWNPLTGCFGPDGDKKRPQRCWYCVAHRMANGFLQKRYLAAPPILSDTREDPFSPRWWKERLVEPRTVKKSARILVVDMGDLFHPAIPITYACAVVEVATACPQHTFLYLTKNPARYQELRSWPGNCWVGTTITNQSDWNTRWPIMQSINAKVRWVSFEPMLGPILIDHPPDWAVIGALTENRGVKQVQGYDALLKTIVYGDYEERELRTVCRSLLNRFGVQDECARWIYGLTRQLVAWKVPVFHKRNLPWQKLTDNRDFTVPLEKRQEFPTE